MKSRRVSNGRIRQRELERTDGQSQIVPLGNTVEIDGDPNETHIDISQFTNFDPGKKGLYIKP